MRTKPKAVKIARIASEKKAEDIVVLDVRKICNFTDFFVLATGNTTTHLRAICEAVEEKFDAVGIRLFGIDGPTATSWRVLDYGDVVFHCFTLQTRHYYDLEHLWGDAKLVAWQK